MTPVMFLCINDTSLAAEGKLDDIGLVCYNGSPLDGEGFRVYIKDGGTVWNPGWQPVQTELDGYSCRQELTQLFPVWADSINAAYSSPSVSRGMLTATLHCTSNDSRYFEMYRYDTEGLLEAQKLLRKLGDSFREVAKQDTSAPVMKNTETMAYGMTYGRNDVTETVTSDANRGFLA